jgi:hypothetical protein
MGACHYTVMRSTVNEDIAYLFVAGKNSGQLCMPHQHAVVNRHLDIANQTQAMG